MYFRIAGDHFEFSPDARTIAYSIPRAAFTDISYACASPTSGYAVLTAVRSGARVANVTANERGDYRAYRVDANGIEQLTKEYTNTAICLPDGGLAYSNGSSLVIARGTGIEKHKVGRFNWGPPSISCNDAGSIVAMTRWKGDDRKLAWTTGAGGALQTSRFSYYSYLLVGDLAYYGLTRDIHAFSFATKTATALTTKKFKEQLLAATDVHSDLADVEIRFSGLSRLAGQLVVSVLILGKDQYDRLYHGVITIDRNTAAVARLYEPENDWSVREIYSNGETLQLGLERYENLLVVESRRLAVGRHDHFLQQQWSMLAVPTQPESGFQFLPGGAA